MLQFSQIQSEQAFATMSNYALIFAKLKHGLPK